jgi:hypothetical protein
VGKAVAGMQMPQGKALPFPQKALVWHTRLRV